MAAKRILLVDDQRDITRMLRVALDALGRGYVIVDAPSGEEALLEVGRGGIDLLITDFRLPGINGLEVIKRLHKTNPESKVIVISGMSDPDAQAEAKRLGAAFFAKPLSLDTFLASVQDALGEKPEAPKPSATTAQAQPGVADRISTLRRDLGASAVFLVDLDGKIVVRAGDVTGLDMDAVLNHLMTAFSASLKLCKLLGGFIPTNVQFFDGDAFDIYGANIGQYFALVIIFDGDRGAGQMGPVMRYGRQCADDLLNSLVTMGATNEPSLKSVAAASSAQAATPQTSAIPVTPKPRTAPLPEAPPPAPAKPLTEKELKALDEAAKKVDSKQAASFWDEASIETEASDVRSDALSFEQAEKLGLIPKE
jgi:CheY-like chemotaxis protein